MAQKKPHNFKPIFFTGLLTIIPVMLTMALTVWLFNLLTGYVPPLLKSFKLDDRYVFLFQILSLFLFVVLTYCVGLFAKNYLGIRFIEFFNKILLKIPIIKTIYSTLLQLSKTIFSSDSAVFEQVVMFEYPLAGTYAIGFLTKDAALELKDKSGKDLVCIFIPTTPNPTSGFLLMYERTKVILLEMSVTDAMQLIISAGVVIPDVSQDLLPEKELEKKKK